MDAARVIPHSVELVPVTLDRESQNDERPELLDHADYIQCCAGAAANHWLYAGGREWPRREWKRLAYAIACFGNVRLAETTDSVEAMDAAAPKMMACAVALNARKESK